MISAETVSPSVFLRSPPSPASRTSPRVMVSPASPASFSTTILSPAATRYCLPPVRTIANMAFFRCFKMLDRAGRGPRGDAGCYIGTALLSTKGGRAFAASMTAFAPQRVAPVGKAFEHAGNGGMVDRLALAVGDQILLADI